MASKKSEPSKIFTKEYNQLKATKERAEKEGNSSVAFTAERNMRIMINLFRYNPNQR